jgi:hypothetical protein
MQTLKNKKKNLTELEKKTSRRHTHISHDSIVPNNALAKYTQNKKSKFSKNGIKNKGVAQIQLSRCCRIIRAWLKRNKSRRYQQLPALCGGLLDGRDVHQHPF